MIDRDRHGMHVFCYKNFTNTTHVKAALARVATETVVARSPYIIRKHLESSASAAAVASTSTCASTSDNVNPNLFPQDSCLFCSKGPTKKHGRYVGLAKCQTSPASRRIKEYAVLKKDFSLVGKVSGFSLAPRVARFHEHCRRNYVAKADRRSRQTSVLNDTVVEETVVDDADDDADNSYLSGTNEHRKAYDEAFKHVCSYIEEDIINKGNAVCMTALREMYLEYIQQHSPLYYNPSHKTQKLKLKLKQRILRHFEDRIRFSQSNNKTDLLYSANISTGAAVEAAFESATSESQLLHNAAMILHRHILQAQSTSPGMPWPPSVSFLDSATICPPSSLSEFVKTVITGKSAADVSDRVARVTSSVSEDICEAATCGQWKMPKHLLLGMALRHFTGSSKVIIIIIIIIV